MQEDVVEKEITSSIREYRAIIMSLWRNLSGYAQEEYDWDLCDAFADICDGIFSMTVLRPHGIEGVNKAKQYDRFPAGIPCLICVPEPQTRTVPVLMCEWGRSRWELAALQPDRWTFFFVDLNDFELYSPDRSFTYILTQAVPAESANACSRLYALLPADTTRILLRRND